MKALLAPFVLLAAAPAAPPAIHLNQLGFLPDGPKRAVIATDAATALDWQVVDAAGKVAARGRTEPVGDDAASGDKVQVADFSALTTPGEYRLRVAGAESKPFAVRAGLYAPVAKGALNFFYQQRAGVPIEAGFAGGERWARPAGHKREVAACFKGADPRGTVWPGCDYTIDVTGGWYDAGDHGKYVVNGGISLWTLLNLYEVTRAFPDGSAALPEAGNGVSDLLDEARVELDFLLRMQVPEGTRTSLPVGQQPRDRALTLTPVDAGGMAHHKIADANWTKLPMPPHEDRETRLLYPPSTSATLNLAAVAAQGARLWRTIDPAFAARSLAAARRAFAAAQRNPEVYAATAFTGSGGYGDAQLADEFFWAAAELYATTGEAAYRDVVTASPRYADTPVSEPSWSDVGLLGTVTLATAPGIAEPVAAHERARLTALADRFAGERAQTGYRIPYATMRYPWGSNGAILNRGMILGAAHKLSGTAEYRAAMIDTLDYVLGRNPLDQSYVAGFGWRPLANPHHRFWAPSLDKRLPGPPPGTLSGGTNNTAFADEVAKRSQGKCAPQRCWADDVNAYALNEVAINWNAPLFWVAAWLDSPTKK
jgi:endoglucanase